MTSLPFSLFLLLEEIHNKKGAFIDFPFVEPQDGSMTEDTRQRWQSENMGERYIYVVDDLERLKELGIPLKDLKPTFLNITNTIFGTDF